MFIEKRKSGKNIKYYLVHSYRDETGKGKKIRRYLGSNISKKKLNKLRQRAEELIKKQVLDLKKDLFEFSLSLSEVRSLNKYNDKLRIIHLNKKEWIKFTQDFAYNTNAIEGSEVLKKDIPTILKKTKLINTDEIETKGVVKAINYIQKSKQDLSLDLIKKLHKLCFAGSKNFAGQFRKVEVVIKDLQGNIIHAGVKANNLEKELDEFIKWYKQNKKKFKPLVLAAIVHNQFEHIHPFRDGNGRVGRLLLNFILLKNNFPPINILLKDRSYYYKTLQEYSNNRNLKPTLEFLVKQYKKMLKTNKGNHKK